MENIICQLEEMKTKYSELEDKNLPDLLAKPDSLFRDQKGGRNGR